ncbi:cyclin-like protein interacting with PHO85 [Lecanora helva]
MEDVAVSNLVSDFARFPAMMIVGDPHQASSTRSEPFRSSAHAVNTFPPSQETSAHIRFRDASTAYTAQQEGEHHYDHHHHLQPQEQHAVEGKPPPSPRLEPTYRSALSLNGSLASSPSRIKVRDLEHIQSFASEEVLNRSRHPSRHSLRGRIVGGQQYEISAMPVGDIIEMVAGLLTKITNTNDRQHENLHRTIPSPDGTTGLSTQATSVLAFHGKNVPSISIASYLSRIHKYCPTTYEVFLSLLIYFDRMTELVNSGSLKSFSQGEDSENRRSKSANRGSNASSITAVPSPPISDEDSPSPRAPTIVSSSGSDSPETYGYGVGTTSSMPPRLSDADAYDLSHFFVVDSYNIHRLVIAGVTCASKFFSDVFYTNSRYAKVGGLPLNELNHLELQFLLLNDFRLSIPIDELESYGTKLVQFYAREVVGQQQGHHSMEGLYMQTPTPA